MAELKPGWRNWRFDQMATSVTNRVDDPTEAGVEYYVGLQHLDSDSLKIKRWGTPDEVSATKLLFEPGDVVFGRRRAYQRKLGVAEFKGIASAHSLVLRASPDVVLPEFLPFFLQSDVFMERAQEISVGSLSPTINWKTLARQKFALPPLQEQRRMVRLFNAIVSTEKALDDVLEGVKKVRESIVEDFVAKSQEAHSTSTLKRLCKRVTDGTHQPPKFTDQGIPFFLVKTISSGYVDWEHTKFVSQDTYDSLTSRVRPKRGDVLFTAVGTYGVALLVDFDEPFVFQRHIAHIIPDPERIDARFLALFLNSRHGKRQSDRAAIGSAQPTVTLKSLSSFWCPCPPLEEQRLTLRARWQPELVVVA